MLVRDEQYVHQVFPQPPLSRIRQFEHVSCAAGVAVKQYYAESTIRDGVELRPLRGEAVGNGADSHLSMAAFCSRQCFPIL